MELMAMSLGLSVTFSSLVPLMKSHPSSHAHNGSLSSTPRMAATNGREGPPAFRSMSPTRNLFPPKAWVTGARVQSARTILLWNNLSPGSTRMGNVAGRKTRGARAPCSNAGKAHMTNGGDLVWYDWPRRSADPCLGQTIFPSGDDVGKGNVIWLAHSPSSAHAWVQWTGSVAMAVAMGVHRSPELANRSTSGDGTFGHRVRSSSSQMRSLQPTIGHNDHASIDFRFGLRTQEDSRFTCWLSIASDGMWFHASGLVEMALRHTDQFFNFEQAGGYTVGVDQNDVFVRK